MRSGFLLRCTSAVLTENTLFGIDPSLERNYLEGVLPMAITTVTDATAITVGIEATATVTATAGMALTAITVAGVDGCIAKL